MPAADISEAMTRASSLRDFPDGTSYRSLSAGRVAALSRDFDMPGKDVEIKALEAGLLPERYARNMKSFSMAEQAKLLQSTASIVGLGGLGGVVSELLSRLGVGTLNLIDGDTFEESNLNRQLLSAEQNLGEPKVAVARRHIASVNSSVIVRTHEAYFHDGNGIRFVADSDVIVDCLDNVKDRFAVERAAGELGCPMVSAAVAGHAGHVTSIFPGERSLEKIYGKGESAPAAGAEASQGCLPQAVALIAALECSEVSKILTNKDAVLRNKMLAVDLVDNHFEVMQLS